MRPFYIVRPAAFFIAATFVSAVVGQTPNSADEPTAVWKLLVLDGKIAVRDDAQSRRDRLTIDTSPGQIPGTRAHVWTPAAWGLQLGSTSTPHVFRTYFGPDEGMPVPGDFDGDGFDELAVFVDGRWHLDFNGNCTWDADDLWIKAGEKGDRPVVGDWNQDGKTDIGYVSSNVPSSNLAEFGWKSIAGLHSPASSISDVVICTGRGCFAKPRNTKVRQFGSVDDTPVIGRWKQSDAPSIGTFRDGLWKLDFDGDGKFTDDDRVVRLGEPGDRPIVGDFNRDGIDELGVYRRGTWIIDTSGDLRLGDGDRTYKLGDANDVPVVGDWDGDGADQIGIIARGGVRPIDSF